ncbi:hypothetical protein [Kitasatospora sp. NPDC050463]|uniref:Rv1733c family protein n=1 Tax=Kitasatospora sp. NPDC050463 TaxID=3155786 RepID=UPI0033CDC313
MSTAPAPAPPAATTRRWRRHVRRAVGVERNPLTRPLDRARSRALLAAALGIVLSALLGTGTALADLRLAQQHSTTALAHLHHIEAVLLGPVRQTSTSLSFAPPSYQAQAAWTYPSGQPHTATISVPGRAAAGSTTPIWVNDTGTLATTPSTGADTTGEAIFIGLFTLGCLSVLVATGLGLRLRTLDRRAAHAWQRSWERLKPLGTGRAAPQARYHRPA